eukprot:1047938-Rhodomonas_salina.2
MSGTERGYGAMLQVEAEELGAGGQLTYLPTRCYAKSGTHIAYGATIYLHTRDYAKSGTDKAYGTTIYHYFPKRCYAMSGTDIA